MSLHDRAMDCVRFLSAGRYDFLANEFTFPLPVYIGPGIYVLVSADDAWGFFQTLHSCVRLVGSQGDVRQEVQMAGPGNQRFSVQIDWHLDSPCRASATILRMEIFCTSGLIGDVTEMVHVEFPTSSILTSLLQDTLVESFSREAKHERMC